MKVLVTGGAGFIGSHLAEGLSKDHEVVILDNLSTGRLENIKNLIENDKVDFIRGDLTDITFLRGVIKDIDCVFHQAAVSSVTKSIENPSFTNNANINGTLNVLITSRDASVKKVIYASSSAVYGNSPELPKREDMEPNPLSPYAVTKLSGEYYCKVFYEVYGLKTVSLRYFNVFGPKQDPSSEYAAVIPKFISSILYDTSPIIYGDGEQSRDFIFVKDIVQANMVACKPNVTGVFNIACGKRITVNELAGNINTILGKNIIPIHGPLRKGDIMHSVADIRKAKKVLGYEPKYGLKEGLIETIKWFANRV